DREHEHVIVTASNDTPAVATSRRRRRARAISSSCTRRWWHPGTVRWMREPFSRIDPEDDAVFYSLARKVVHLEPGAIEDLGGVCAARFPPGAAGLDVVSSGRSPPPDGRGRAVGLGMTAEEMEANPHLDERVAHDLNRDPPLPFPDGSFDAVACAVSVQYLV